MPRITCRRSSIWLICLLILLGCARSVYAQEALEKQALTWFKNGDYNRARTAFQQMLTADPRHPVALYHLGHIEADEAVAEQYYLRLLHHAPKHHYADDAMLAVAQIYYRQGRYREAVETCNRLLTSYPETKLNDQARHWLGRALLADRQPVLARLTFFQLLNVHPQSQYAMHARLGIADTFRAEGALIEAVKAYLKFESDYRDSDSLYVALFRAGQCLEAADRRLEAEHVYRRLIDRFPDSLEAREARNRIGEKTSPRSE